MGSILGRYVDRHLKLRGVAASKGSRRESFRSYREKLTLSWVKFRPSAFPHLKLLFKTVRGSIAIIVLQDDDIKRVLFMGFVY